MTGTTAPPPVEETVGDTFLYMGLTEFHRSLGDAKLTKEDYQAVYEMFLPENK